MSNVRKVTSRRHDGSEKVSWRATWTGADGKRQSKNFPRKGNADAHLKSCSGITGSASMTVIDLAEGHYRWFDGLVKTSIREAATRDGYWTALDKHLRPHPVSKVRLSNLTTPQLQELLDDVFASTGSASICVKLRKSLVTWCKFGQRKGWLAANLAAPCSVETTGRRDEDYERFVIPPKSDLARLILAADELPRDGAVVRLLMFGGPRISELLGAADEAVPLTAKGAELRIRERLERRYGTLGKPKSAKARRNVTLGPSTARALKLWRLARGQPPAFMHNGARKPGRLFPNPDGSPLWCYDDFIRDCWFPLMRRAGLLEMLPDSRGKLRPSPALWPHTLRHVAASLWISQRPQPTPKKIQEMLGHSTIQLTMDLYGHLWTDEGEDGLWPKLASGSSGGTRYEHRGARAALGAMGSRGE